MTPGQPGNGKTGRGFIQNVSVGGKNDAHTHTTMRTVVRGLGRRAVGTNEL